MSLHQFLLTLMYYCGIASCARLDLVSTVYYSSWSYDSGHLPSDIDLSLVTHVNFAFFNIDYDTLNLTLSNPTSDAASAVPFHTSNLTPESNTSLPWAEKYNTNIQFLKDNEVYSMGVLGQLNQLKSVNPRLTISMSIGGDNSARFFKRVANNRRAIDYFVTNTIAQLQYYGFDGIDIDWEFPDATIDKSYLTYLMYSLRNGLDKIPHGCQDYMLSMALPMDIDSLHAYDFSSLPKIVDYFHLMGYDASTPKSGNVSLQSPLYTDPMADNDQSINGTVHHLIDAGVPSTQIVLGVPLYGYAYTVDKLYQPNKMKNCKIADVSVAGNVIQYHELPPNGFSEIFNKDVGSSYAVRANPPCLIVYDNPDSMRLKSQYIIDNNLGGAYWWDSKGDPWSTNKTRSLVRTFVDTLASDEDLKQEMCSSNSNNFFSELKNQTTPYVSAASILAPIQFTLLIPILFNLLLLLGSTLL